MKVTDVFIKKKKVIDAKEYVTRSKTRVGFYFLLVSRNG